MNAKPKKKKKLWSVVLPSGKTLVLPEDAAIFRLRKIADLAAQAHKARQARNRQGPPVASPPQRHPSEGPQAAQASVGERPLEVVTPCSRSMSSTEDALQLLSDEEAWDDIRAVLGLD